MGWGLSSGVFGWWPFWCAFVPWAAWLAWHDLSSRRLPDHLTLPAGAVAGLFSLYDGSSTAFTLGAMTWAGAYGAVGVVKHDAMGGGDVKLALALGGATAVAAGVPGTLLAMVIAGLLTGIAGMLARRPTLPHGPSMLVACAGVMLGGPMGLWALRT